MLGPRAHQKAHGRRAIGERSRESFQTELRDLVHGHWNDIRRQAVAVAGEHIDHLQAMLAVMKQKHWICAAGVAIDGKQRA